MSRNIPSHGIHICTGGLGKSFLNGEDFQVREVPSFDGESDGDIWEMLYWFFALNGHFPLSFWLLFASIQIFLVGLSV